jgi:hypothetical protein
MGSPFSFGDFVRLVELVQWVNTNCIDPGKNPKKQYLDFQKDVHYLRAVLADFEDAILQAISHLNGYDLSTVSRHYGLIEQANRLVKDFVLVLEDSQRLLEVHVKYDSRKGSFFEAALWHASTQAKMDDLRQHIRDHTDQLSLFISSVSLRLATETSEKAREIHDKVVRGKTSLPNFPTGLESKFEEAFRRHPTSRMSHPSKLPPTEVIDIMLMHFQQCSAPPLKSDSEQQYLHLLKAHWLVDTLSRSESLETSQGEVYRRLVEKIRRAIAEQYQREDIRQHVGQPLKLDTPDYEIWPHKNVIPDPNLTDPLAQEDLLLRVPIVSPNPHNEKRELFVFRKDTQYLRIVYLRSPTDPNQRVRETETFFDLSADRLIPFYAIATGQRTEYDMQMFYSRGATQVDFPLPTRGAAFQLQRAFIGYATVAYSKDVTCTITYKKKGLSIRDGLHVSLGEVQLLQMPLHSNSPNPPTLPPPNRTMTSSQSGSTFSTASRVFRNANPSLTVISEAASDRTVVITQLPVSPLLMAFTVSKTNSIYTFWSFKRKLRRSNVKTSF